MTKKKYLCKNLSQNKNEPKEKGKILLKLKLQELGDQQKKRLDKQKIENDKNELNWNVLIN